MSKTKVEHLFIRNHWLDDNGQSSIGLAGTITSLFFLTTIVCSLLVSCVRSHLLN